MKIKLILIAFFISIFQIKAQQLTDIKSDLEPYNTIVETSENKSIINLLNINYNGDKIPINIIYDHRGFKMDSKPEALGIGWRLSNIGIIQHIIKDKNDNETLGWFKTAYQQLESYARSGRCYDGDCSEGDFDAADQSPDIFKLSISNGINFDFTYNKDFNGKLNSIIINNNNDYKIHTNFENFYTYDRYFDYLSHFSNYQINNNNYTFSITDNYSNKYDFIRGYMKFSIENDLYATNDYYLSKITNKKNNQSINIEYYDNLPIYNYNTYYSNFLINKNINEDNSLNSYGNYGSGGEIDNYEKRIDIKKIETDYEVIIFKYNPIVNQYQNLEEIEVYDKFGNMLYSYLFEYDSDIFGQYNAQLIEIKKSNFDKSKYFSFLSFEYFNEGYRAFSYFNTRTNFSDYFGYFNGIDNSINNLNGPVYPPFTVHSSDNPYFARRAGNYSPNLDKMKSCMLKKILYGKGGHKEFEYEIFGENHNDFGKMYAGGLIIKSITETPKIGLQKKTIYSNSNLSGFVLYMDNENVANINQFITRLSNILYNSASHEFVLYEHDYFYERMNDNINHSQNFGAFYQTEYQYNYDLSSNRLESTIVRNYTINPEGNYLDKLLLSEMISDNDGRTPNQIKYYNYSQEKIDEIGFTRTNRYFTNGGRHWTEKGIEHIYINRVKLKDITVKDFNTSIQNKTFYEYLSPNSNRIKKVTNVGSLNENYTTEYFYPENLISEPHSNNLIEYNYVNDPLIIKQYKDNVLLSSLKNNIQLSNNYIIKKSIGISKGDNPIDIKSEVTKIDENTGNILEIKHSNGIYTSYIWGYNNTHIIASVLNSSFNNLPENLIREAQNASNNNNENLILAKLNEIRNHPNLNEAMVTSFTLKPGVGKLSETDINGKTTYYEYDDFNNLKFIKDYQGNILQENLHHLQNQN